MEFIHYKTRQTFDTQLNDLQIEDDDICFIQDTKQIYTHDTIYECNNPKTNIIVLEAGTESLSAVIGKYYTATSVETLAITLPTVGATNTSVENIVFFLETGSTPSITFTPVYAEPSSLTFSANSIYEITATWNGLGWILKVTQLQLHS